LSDGWQTGKGAVDDRKVDIDTRLDELGGDDACRLAIFEPLPNLSKNSTAVRWAHQR
jgi:hypothetical protein